MAFLGEAAYLTVPVQESVRLALVHQISKFVKTSPDNGDGVWFSFQDSTDEAANDFFEQSRRETLDLSILQTRYYDRIQVRETKTVVKLLFGRLVLRGAIRMSMSDRDIFSALEDSIRNDDITRVPWDDAREARLKQADPVDDEVSLNDRPSNEGDFDLFQDMTGAQPMDFGDWDHDAQPHDLAALPSSLLNTPSAATRKKNSKKRSLSDDSSDDDSMDLLQLPRSPMKRRVIATTIKKEPFEDDTSNEPVPSQPNVYSQELVFRDSGYGTVNELTVLTVLGPRKVSQLRRKLSLDAAANTPRSVSKLKDVWRRVSTLIDRGTITTETEVDDIIHFMPFSDMDTAPPPPVSGTLGRRDFVFQTVKDEVDVA